MIHTGKGFSIVTEAEINVFMEFYCFFYDPMDVGNLICYVYYDVYNITLYILIITLNTNGLNAQNKDTDWLKGHKIKIHIYAV